MRERALPVDRWLLSEHHWHTLAGPGEPETKRSPKDAWWAGGVGLFAARSYGAEGVGQGHGGGGGVAMSIRQLQRSGHVVKGNWTRAGKGASFGLPLDSILPERAKPSPLPHLVRTPRLDRGCGGVAKPMASAPMQLGKSWCSLPTAASGRSSPGPFPPGASCPPTLPSCDPRHLCLH